MWLGSGARSVWVVDPKQLAATMYRSDGSAEPVASDGVLRDELLLAGFSLKLRDVF